MKSAIMMPLYVTLPVAEDVLLQVVETAKQDLPLGSYDSIEPYRDGDGSVIGISITSPNRIILNSTLVEFQRLEMPQAIYHCGWERCGFPT